MSVQEVVALASDHECGGYDEILMEDSEPRPIREVDIQEELPEEPNNYQKRNGDGELLEGTESSAFSDELDEEGARKYLQFPNYIKQIAGTMVGR